MSGGHFEYNQHKIYEIAESIQSILDRQGKEIPKEDRWSSDDTYEKYSEETQKEFKRAVELLRIAYVYAQRIDWFLSGDDGEDTFHKRLKDELNKITDNK